MNRKWSEKTTLQKTMDVISMVALCIWVVFEILERSGKFQYAQLISCIAIIIVCVCEAVSFWNVRRSLSYVAIGGAVLLTVVIVLGAILLA